MSRSDFLKPPGAYFLSHSVGCLPVQTEQQGARLYFDSWARQGGDAWETWLSLIEAFKASLSQVLNAQAKELCPQVNISSALTKILGSLPLPDQHKNVILLSEHDFPSSGFVFEQAKRLGYRLKFFSKEAPLYDLEQWRSLIDERVCIVHITHVSSVLSQLAPVKEIVSLAHQHNAVSIVDVAQSVGVVPIDVNQWQADFILGSCVKWLCGGAGAGFLWVNSQRVHDCSPMDVGWFSHQQPFEFDMHHFEYAEDARRFLGGTPSVLPYVVAAKSIDVMVDVGIEEIRQHNLKLTEKIINAAESLDIPICSPKRVQHRGGTVTLKLESSVMTLLQGKQIHFDTREQSLCRFSPHIYTGGAELDVLFDVLEA